MESFEHLLYQLHLSYLQARKNKRNTHNQLAFELNQETNLHQLAKAIFERKYTPKPCIAFIIQKPVMREIFAADFTDRVIHHLIYRCIYPIIDNKLIYDTYSCRVGKGTHFGIQRVDKFIRQCSKNYSSDCYILKLDLQGFFMSINKPILFTKLEKFINEKHQSTDKDLILKLCKQVIFNDPTKYCIIKGNKSDWELECRDYNEVLKELANQQIEFDLDDGVDANYAKFEGAIAVI